MTERRRPMRPEEQRARDEIRSLPEETPRDDFRMRLRQQFVSPSASEENQPSDAPRTSETPDPSPSTSPRLRRSGSRRAGHPRSRRVREEPNPTRRRWVVLGPSLAAAAALVWMVYSHFFVVQYLDWQQATVVGEGEVLVDGKPVRPPGPGEPWPEMSGERMVQTGKDTELTLLGERDLLWVYTPQTKAKLPGIQRWGPRLDCELEGGEVRLTTAPCFRPTLIITTPEAEVRVTGTTVAVIRNDEGTCICVFEGEVGVTNKMRGDDRMIPPGKRWVVRKDGEQTDFQDLEGMESMKLSMLRDGAEWED